MSRFDNSTPAAQRARNISNANKSATQAPVQRSPVPSPAAKPVVLPTMRTISTNKGAK